MKDLSGISIEEVTTGVSSPVKCIGVDFDGVIHTYSKGWHDGSIYDPPIPGSLEALSHLMTKYAVAIISSREPHSIAQWLRDRCFAAYADPEGEHAFWNNQSCLLVTQRKIGCVAYIDDRAIHFENWQQTLDALEGRIGP